MSLFDVTLIVILSGFVFYGLFFGLVRMLGSFLGVIAGSFVASHFYLDLFGLIKNFTFGYDNLAKVICFLLLFSLVGRLISYLFGVVEKIFDLISIIPFLKSINRLAGAIAGFFVGSLIMGLIIFVSSKYVIVDTLIGGWLTDSQIAPFLIKVMQILMPFLDKGFKMVQGLI